MPITMQRVARLPSPDRQALFSWGSNIWGTHGLGGNKLICKQPDQRFVRYVDDAAVSHVGLTTTWGQVGASRVIRIAGLGSIVTPAAHQRQGHATALIQWVLETVPEVLDADLVVLFCLNHRRGFYEGIGWVPIVTPVFVGQPHSQMREVGWPYSTLMRPTAWWTTAAGPLRIVGLPW